MVFRRDGRPQQLEQMLPTTPCVGENRAVSERHRQIYPRVRLRVCRGYRRCTVFALAMMSVEAALAA